MFASTFTREHLKTCSPPFRDSILPPHQYKDPRECVHTKSHVTMTKRCNDHHCGVLLLKNGPISGTNTRKQAFFSQRSAGRTPRLTALNGPPAPAEQPNRTKNNVTPMSVSKIVRFTRIVRTTRFIRFTRIVRFPRISRFTKIPESSE